MNDRLRKTIVIFFLLIVVSGLSFGFILTGINSGGREVQKYDGIKFRLDPVEDIWIANINEASAAFKYLPQETEFITIGGEPLSLLRDKAQIDVTSDINDTLANEIALAKYQLGIVLSNYNVFIRDSFDSENEFGLPVVHCNNSTEIIPVVHFKAGNNSKISTDGQCIVVEATKGDMIRAKDRLVYGLLGVIE